MKTICEQIPEPALRPVSKQTALCVGAVLRDTLARRHPEAITEGRRRLLGDEMIMVYAHSSRTLALSTEELLEVEADGGQDPRQQFEELKQNTPCLMKPRHTPMSGRYWT
jgi:hypothetical protein